MSYELESWGEIADLRSVMHDARYTIYDYREAKNKLTEIKSATADSWEDLNVCKDAALDDLKNAS